MADLTRIPTEIWHTIFTWACTDGGFTGRSLALTSKFFHDQSLSTRFHSLALESLQQVEHFLVALYRQPQDYKPRVLHIFLSFVDEPIKVPLNLWRIYTRTTGEKRRDYGREILEEGKAWDQRFDAAMSTLFALVSPTLRTLCLVSDVSVQLPHISFDILPVLEELTVATNTDAILTQDTVKRTEVYPWSRFPALSRLHCVCQGTLPVTTVLKDGPPPFLTHLRLSSSRVGFRRGVIGRMLGLVDCDSGNPPGVHTDLTRLQHVVLHGYPPRPGGLSIASYLTWEHMCQEMEAFAERCGEKGIRMVVLSRPWRRNPRWPERLHDEWVDRIEGGRGPWVEGAAQEAELEVYDDEPPSPVEEEDEDEDVAVA